MWKVTNRITKKTYLVVEGKVERFFSNFFELDDMEDVRQVFDIEYVGEVWTEEGDQ